MAGTLSLADLRRWVETYAAEIEENRQYLTKLDSAIGDADHGINMHRGFKTALERLDDPEDVGSLLKSVGMALVSKVGGAAGPLYGTFFIQAASAVADQEELAHEDWAKALAKGIEGVVSRGKAEPGDKTMVDALRPALEAFEEALAEGEELADAVRRAEAAAEEGMKATIDMVARKGRASYMGERSRGHQDPGATSSYLLFKSMVDAWTERKEE